MPVPAKKVIFSTNKRMKKTILLAIIILAAATGKAQVSDSAVKVYSNFICSCVDTISIQQPEDAIKKQVKLCKSIGLTVILNQQLISPDVLSSKDDFRELDTKMLTHLVENCEKFKQIVKVLMNEPEYAETNDVNLFIPAAFFTAYGMKAGETNELLHVYNNFGNNKELERYQRAVDIRWTFKNEADARRWLKMNLEKESEGGVPVKDKIALPGASELYVLREGPQALEMLKAFGLDQRHHYFIFIYKNVVCKVFIATDGTVNTSTLVPFAEAAMEQVKKTVN